MLNVFYGRENINKDRFIYENIKGKAIVLVPDQFTIQAERDAFFYMQTKGMMDVEILSFSRLTDRVFGEAGGGRVPMIDKQGRHMLLTKIMKGIKQNLKIYKNYGNNTAFIEMTNNFISETKAFGRSPEDLKKISNKLPEERYLRLKLEDMQQIYEKYQEHIEGKYIDTEDKISLMIERLNKTKIVSENVFWIYGFDYFAPKNKEIVAELIKSAAEVNLIITWDDKGRDKELFDITGGIIDYFKEYCSENEIGFNKEQIGGEYKESRPKAIFAIEENLFALPYKTTEETQGLTITKAAGYYSEAESAAAKVLQLVREKNMRYRDISIICNDLAIGGNIYKRIFSQYGINLFVDDKKNIMHTPIVNYILALTNIIAGAYQPDDVMNLVKTGLSDLTDEEGEVFENYIKIYGIKGPAFRSDFQRGVSEIGSGKLEKLNEYRHKVIDGIMVFAEEYKKENTVEGKIKALYTYLTETCRLPEKTERQIKELTDEGQLEAAAESAQIWNVAVGIFDQLIEVIGDESISQKDFAAVFKSGFEAVEIGLIPPTVDGVIMGTMQRTRTGTKKAILVLGANEGILPAEGADDGILNEDEKLELAAMEDEGEKVQLCKLDKLRVQEENLAIYRNLSKATEELWISCSVSDAEGKSIRSSQIYETVCSICNNVKVQNDILTKEDKIAMLSHSEIGVTHITEAYRQAMKSGELDSWWKESYLWYKDQKPEIAEKIAESLLYKNAVDKIEKEVADSLYKKEGVLSLSPSRLEKFGKCPFSHFIAYGLRPEELREYQVGPMEMGDIYHKALMMLSKQLTRKGMEITDNESPWMNISKEECFAMTEEIIEEAVSNYKDGVFEKDKQESYRSKRVKEICCNAAWIMVEHIRQGSVKSMEQEIGFGRGKTIEPITVNNNGEDLYIEGIIDRVDYLTNDNVKIIDYKSGKDKYNKNEALSGWKLQLFVYLRAACEKTKKPAGAFYFHIADPEVPADGLSATEMEEKVSKEIRKAFKMEGVVVNEEAVINSVDSTMDGWSTIIPARNSTKGISGSAEKVLSREEMESLMEEVNENMDEMCRQLSDGKIQMKPKRTKDMTACAYCKYKGICKFDISFEGCEYENI